MRRMIAAPRAKDRESRYGINALFASARPRQAPKPASAGAPQAQGLTGLRGCGTIMDAVNRELSFKRRLSRSGALLQQPEFTPPAGT